MCAWQLARVVGFALVELRPEMTFHVVTSAGVDVLLKIQGTKMGLACDGSGVIHARQSDHCILI